MTSKKRQKMHLHNLVKCFFFFIIIIINLGVISIGTRYLIQLNRHCGILMLFFILLCFSSKSENHTLYRFRKVCYFLIIKIYIKKKRCKNRNKNNTLCCRWRRLKYLKTASRRMFSLMNWITQDVRFFNLFSFSLFFFIGLSREYIIKILVLEVLKQWPLFFFLPSRIQRNGHRAGYYNCYT